jgi:hypothetical protein
MAIVGNVRICRPAKRCRPYRMRGLQVPGIQGKRQGHDCTADNAPDNEGINFAVDANRGIYGA